MISLRKVALAGLVMFSQAQAAQIHFTAVNNLPNSIHISIVELTENLSYCDQGLVSGAMCRESVAVDDQLQRLQFRIFVEVEVAPHDRRGTFEDLDVVLSQDIPAYITIQATPPQSENGREALASEPTAEYISRLITINQEPYQEQD
ncbi:hypothetical protein EBZ39_13055 [bacterium]|nr:hypothetical protein [bacterium]